MKNRIMFTNTPKINRSFFRDIFCRGKDYTVKSVSMPAYMSKYKVVSQNTYYPVGATVQILASGMWYDGLIGRVVGVHVDNNVSTRATPYGNMIEPRYNVAVQGTHWLYSRNCVVYHKNLRVVHF